jgi:hypothetical protein
MRWHFPLAVLVAAFPFIVRAQTAPATQATAELKLAVERLVVFKDGHGLVIKTGGGIADDDGRAFITEVPDAAVLGCFWATSDDKIVAMRAEWHEDKRIREQETACVTVAELLRANVGKPMTLELTQKRENGMPVAVEGTLLELLDVPPDKEQLWTRRPTASHTPSIRAYPSAYSSMIINGVAQTGAFTPESFIGEGTLVRELVPRGGDFIVLSQPNDQRLVIPVAQIQSLRGGTNLDTTTTHSQEIFTRSKRLSFDFGKASAGKDVKLRLFYFTPGLRWIPTYRISGDLKDKANLALQGEILNDVTDVEHAALDLVVGVPHFRFDNTISPLVLEQTMRVAAEAMNLGNNNFLNSQFDNRARVSGGQPVLDAGMTAAPELAGSGGEQDLFVYNIPDFSLKKGARATVPLWEQTTELKHIYTFNLATKRTRSSGALIEQTLPNPAEQQQSAVRRPPNMIVLNQVWHQLELINGGKVPWTTGAALMLRGTLPLGQDLLTYTPPGSKALLPVTVSVDLRGSIDEQEISRKPNALRYNSTDYTQITKKGTITINSFRNEKSQMRISFGTAGVVSKVSDDGQIKLNDGRGDDWDSSDYARLNNHTDVTWDVTIEPGEKKTITYEVSFYTH